MSPEMTVTVPGIDLDTKLAWLRTNVQSNAAYLVTVDKTEYLSGITSSNDNSNNYLSYSSLYSYGSGVYVNSNGTFTKTGGTVYGYTADDSNSNVVKRYNASLDNNGHAVYVNSSPKKRRESTAGPTVSMDSAVEGTAGGWED